MTDPADVVETIKSEGDKFVLYSKDGKKKLGEHPTKAKAEAQEQALKARQADAGEGAAPLAVGLVKDVATGNLELLEGGRYMLNEADGDLARMSDGNLKKLRSTLTGKRAEKRTAHKELAPQDQYNTPEGSALLDDLYYYGGLIQRLESEMACRMLTLD